MACSEIEPVGLANGECGAEELLLIAQEQQTHELRKLPHKNADGLD
jgi:hypothetical protein